MKLEFDQFNIKHFEIDKPVNHQSGVCRMVVVINNTNENHNYIFNETMLAMYESTIVYNIDNSKIVLLGCKGEIKRKDHYATLVRDNHRVFVLDFEFYEMIVRDKQEKVYNEERQIIA